MNETVMRRLAKPMLFAAAFIWGSSFFIMKGAVDVIPIFYLLAIRFTGGAALLALFCARRWKTFTRDYLWRGAIIGGLLFLAYAVQTFGLAETTPSKNAFLTAVYCVIVPFLYWLIAKQRPDRYNILAAVLCVSGVGLVSLTDALVITRGDALTLCCAVFYAGHIVAVAKVSPKKDIYLLTVFQFAWAAAYAWICGLLFQDFPPAAVLLNADMLIQMGYLITMATTVALLFQNVGQVWSDPASAAVILSLESVFGVLCSVLFYYDPVTPRLVAGFALIFVAVVCSETKFSFLQKRPQTAAKCSLKKKS
ncbi:DMT family transporter [Pseudoflavonifractor sp. 524-17]|uniref:DMT family transporter n=1 Tax=Pseudoflavonifractor sp. 524-17 TaxID=2304577 RepID=UPI001379F3E6|nr:DMT family transporter [Pseudoflavonifractor sp. 524-17]NCE65005.1 DMT family transporter [Pseudoflavonifractor sp. 524-17]